MNNNTQPAACAAAIDRRFSVAALVAALATAIAAGGDARAEPNPYSIGVSQGFGHDSNLFRTDTNRVPDKYSITGLQAGVDQPFGRQRFYANANVRATRYEDITQLNNTAYGLNTGLDWSTIERISGAFNALIDQSLADYGSSIDQPLLTQKNLQTSQQLSARAQIGMASLLSLDGSLTHRRIYYSANEYATSEYSQNSGSVGLTYRPSGLLTLGTALRATRGEYPSVLQANGDAATFSRNDLDLTAIWVPTGLSTINARLSFGRQTSDGLNQRDFSGATGSINWAYLPTGKLSFNTSFSRDTGAEAGFSSIGTNQTNGAGDNSRLTTTFGLTAGYEATAKIKLNAGLRYTRRSLVAQQLIGGLPVQVDGSDSLTTYSLGATYDPTRSLQFGCNAAHESRTASGGLSNNYAATIANCTAQFTLK